MRQGPYVTRVFEGLRLPQLEGQSLGSDSNQPSVLAGIAIYSVIVGAFSLSAQSELGIWRRLLDSEAIPFLVHVLARRWDVRAKREAMAVFPPSVHPNVFLVEDPGEQWKGLLQPDREDRAFAYVMSGDRVELLMLGSPTEDAWDRFLEVARSTGM